MLKNCSNKKCKHNNPQPIENFNKNRNMKDGLANWCKSCKSEYQREDPTKYRVRNKDKMKIYNQQ